MPRSRFIAVGLLLAALVIGVAVPGGADDLATAKSRQKKMQAALDDATRELNQIESERHFAEQRLQAANSRLGYVRDDLAAARRALSGHVSSLYKAGGTRPLSGILGSSAEVVVSRVEFETILQEGQVAAVADAKIAFDSYEAAIKDVKAAMNQMSRLEARSKKTVAELSRNFEKAKQVADKLAGFNTTHLVNGRFVSCPVSKPFSFIDSWGAARSGGRAHKGTDIMNPMGNKVHAIVDGVISRQSTSSLGRHQPVHAGRRRQRVLLRPPVQVRLGHRAAGQGGRADRLQRRHRQRRLDRPPRPLRGPPRRRLPGQPLPVRQGRLRLTRSTHRAPPVSAPAHDGRAVDNEHSGRDRSWCPERQAATTVSLILSAPQCLGRKAKAPAARTASADSSDLVG